MEFVDKGTREEGRRERVEEVHSRAELLGQY